MTHMSSDQSIRIERHPTMPWNLVIWERLSVKAPPSARPHCCYVRTVIFYRRPFSVSWVRNEYRKWDEVETHHASDDEVEFDGALYDCGSGYVKWIDGAWWMERHARYRRPRNEPHLPFQFEWARWLRAAIVGDSFPQSQTRQFTGSVGFA